MSPHIEVSAEKITTILGFPVTNTIIMVWIVVGILALLSYVVSRRVSLIPARLQNIFEMVIDMFIGMMEGVFGSRKKAEKYFPIIATIFLLVLVSNWMGIVPGIGSVGFYEEMHGERVLVPFFRSTASDLNFTLALAVISVVLTNIFGIAAIGAVKHISKFFSFKSPIDFFVGILEFISEIAKIISFSFRLFGNIFAGEVLLIIMAFLAPFIVPVPFLGLEIFVGFIQALVFSMLTMVFISIAVSEQH